MTDVPGFPYALLWRERSVRSVANLTRADATSFLRRAASLALRVDTVRYPLDDANTALADLRAGRLVGAAVLIPPPPG
jgi:propanol-preferring alcohol dehydrogenase